MGSVVEKTIHAKSQREALSILQDSGLFPITVAKVRGQGTAKPRGGARVSSYQVGGLNDTAWRLRATAAAAQPRKIRHRVKRRDLMRLTLQLGSSLRAGVPILSALESVKEQTSSAVLRAVLAQMVIDIDSVIRRGEVVMQR